MGRHGNAVSPEDQIAFRHMIEYLRKEHRMSWGQIFRDADIAKAMPGEQYHDGGAPGSMFQILQDAYKGKAGIEVFDAVSSLYNTKLKVEKPMPKQKGPQGARLSQTESNRIRRLLKTARQRGNTVTDIAKKAGVNATWISTFINSPDQRLMTASKEKLMSVISTMLPQALIDEAYGITTNGAAAPTEHTEREATQRDMRVMAEVLHEVTSIDVFTLARVEIEATMRKLEAFIKPFPKEARRAIEVNVIDRLKLAIEGLGSEDEEEQK